MSEIKTYFEQSNFFQVEGNENDIDIDFLFDENGNKPEDLVYIFRSGQYDEIYLVLKYDGNSNISEYCQKWDNKIMAMINFSDKNLDKIKKLRYNFTQVVLLNGEMLKQIDGECVRFIEKSVQVSRKVLINADSNLQIEADTAVRLPFWYEDLAHTEEKNMLRETLEKLLPDDTSVLYEEREKKRNNADNYDKDEIESIRTWLKSDANN